MNKINLSVIDNLAVSLEAPQKGEVVYELKLSEIIPDPDQPRKERHREEDNNLADSIQSEGVIQPILVRPKSESGDYMIICGERRYDASIQAGLKTIPTIIRAVDSSLILTVQTVENIQRDNMSLADEIAAVAKIAIEHGAKKTAELLGKKSQYVSKRVRVFKADQCIIDFIKTGYSNDFAAFYELALLDDKHYQEAQTIVDAWMTSPMIRTSLRLQIDEVKNRLSVSKNKASVANDGHRAAENEASETGDEIPVEHHSNPQKTDSLPSKSNDHLNRRGMPESFTIESEDDATVMRFLFEDGGNFTIKMDHKDWKSFVNEVNQHKV